ncbi:DUF4837 family protein [Croceivirga thetidis]|uniref:DUF4837 family protein n=1 Tax=Croceivirga thetidis TaxID=2721623 RepID=A0ABX1GMT3_9FLAO|nr:DUF4837 family protein [Croceivirga thetidis]NKI31213.1 DUF4837 family protein [Croceivirga thetidis]
MQKKIKFAILALVFLMVACKQQTGNAKKFLPESTGAVNSLIVVTENAHWQGEVGDRIRQIFAQPAQGLSPIQPIFSITQIPPKIFEGAVRNSRSILLVSQDTLSLGHIKSNVFSNPQKVAVVKGRSKEELLANLDSVAQRAIESFKKTELNEAQRRFKRSLNREKALEEEFGITLNIPSAYKVGKHEDNFVWFDRQIPKGNMNIIAYAMPEDSFKNDSTFVADIIKMRDSIGKKYVPGPYENTFMMTEKAFAPYVFPAEIGGKKGAEAKGIWEINGYPMAGPFLTYIINDKENNRKLVIEGFVFAPSTVKRDYMFEMEAILKTLSWL